MCCGSPRGSSEKLHWNFRSWAKFGDLQTEPVPCQTASGLFGKKESVSFQCTPSVEVATANPFQGPHSVATK